MNEAPDLPPEVRAYLKSTRLLLPETPIQEALAEGVRQMYAPIIDYVTTLSKHFGVEVTIDRVYSDSMRSEAVSAGGRSFIVHDQYLGQVMSMMNRLFLYGSSRMTKLTYFHKLLSQVLSRYGFYEEAIFAVRRYWDRRDEMDHKDKQKKDGSGKHGLYIHVQELYILLHEQAHLLLKAQPELRDVVADEAREWIVGYGEKGRLDRATLDKITADMPAKEREFYIQNADKLIASHELSARFCSEISARNDLVEEFCCDRLALLHMVPYLANRPVLPSAECLRAILLCFLHLRTLQLMEIRCSMESHMNFEERARRLDEKEGIYHTFYNARLHHAKELCYDLFLETESEKREVHRGVARMMDEHTDEILDPAQSSLTTLLYDRQMRERMADEFKLIRLSLFGDQRDHRVISAILHNVDPEEVQRSLRAKQDAVQGPV